LRAHGRAQKGSPFPRLQRCTEMQDIVSKTIFWCNVAYDAGNGMHCKVKTAT